MRSPAIVCGVLVAMLAARAAADTDCGSRWDRLFNYQGMSAPYVEAELPIDAWPWHYAACGLEWSDECVLSTDEHEVTGTIETIGQEQCATLLAEGASIEILPFFIRRFVPDEPLMPGSRYTLDCGYLRGGLTVTTRASTAASAPPEVLEILSARPHEGTSGCCGSAEALTVEFADLSAAYLIEGGYVEIVLPNSQVTTLLSGDPIVEMPLDDGVYRFTPVAANGERGATIELDAVPLIAEATSPCAVDPRGRSLAPWLLAPLLYIGARTRRRRRSLSARRSL